LVRVADQDRASFCFRDELEHGCEDARLRHAGLVDEEHAAARQPVLAVRYEQ